MTRERWQQVCAVFAAAVRCDPTERAILIGATCGADAELRARSTAFWTTTSSPAETVS